MYRTSSNTRDAREAAYWLLPWDGFFERPESHASVVRGPSSFFRRVQLRLAGIVTLLHAVVAQRAILVYETSFGILLPCSLVIEAVGVVIVRDNHIIFWDCGADFFWAVLYEDQPSLYSFKVLI